MSFFFLASSWINGVWQPETKPLPCLEKPGFPTRMWARALPANQPGASFVRDAKERLSRRQRCREHPRKTHTQDGIQGEGITTPSEFGLLKPRERSTPSSRSVGKRPVGLRAAWACVCVCAEGCAEWAEHGVDSTSYVHSSSRSSWTRHVGPRLSKASWPGVPHREVTSALWSSFPDRWQLEGVARMEEGFKKTL